MIDIVAVSLNIQSKEHVSNVLFYFNFDAISLYNTIYTVRVFIYIYISKHLHRMQMLSFKVIQKLDLHNELSSQVISLIQRNENNYYIRP